MKQFIQLDRSFKKPDQLTNFLHELRKAKRKTVLRPTIRVSIIAAILAITLFFTVPRFSSGMEGLANVGAALSNTWTNTKDAVTNQWHMLFPTEAEELDNPFTEEVIVTAEVVNLREEPSIDGEVLDVGYNGESYLFSGTTYTDHNGTTWLEILLYDERIAYVSKQVASVIE